MMRPSGKRAGFTVLEMTIASGIFLLVGVALQDTVLMADRVQETVFDRSETSRDLRGIGSQLVDEFKSTQDASLEVQALPSGDDQVTFQTPISIGGVDLWGVEELGIEGGDPQQDWSLRYTVVDAQDRRLVRQVLDADDAVKSSEVVMGGLSEVEGVPGFSVQQTGDVWAVTLTLDPDGEAGTNGRSIDFHFRTRN